MKICLIHNLYQPYSRGGAEQVVEATIKYLVSKGSEVIFITSTPDKDEIVEDANLRIYRLKQNNIFGFLNLHKHSFLMRFLWHFFDMFNFGIATRVKNILEKEKPVVVHTHNLMGLSFLIPREVRNLKIRHVHTVHDVQLVEPSGIIPKAQEKKRRYNGWLIRQYFLVVRSLVDSPNVVISPSKFLLNFYKEKGFFKKSVLKVLANPLTFGVLNNFSKQEHAGFNFLYLGQIERHKGIFELLETFSKIKEATLHVVGGGTCLEELKTKFQNLDNVIFYGQKSREDLLGIFNKMDVTVFPSLCYENYPAVIFESFYFSIPVLASNHSSIPEFIKIGENGWLFDIEKENDLLVKMNWCLENKTDIKVMSESIDSATLKKNSDNYFVELLGLYE